MALRTIVKDGDPILKKVCRPVTKFDDRLATLLDDMQDTLVDADGLGLAGPQVGMMRRIFICLDDRDLPEEVPANYEYKFIEFINPEILASDGDQVYQEGCLSVPGIYADVTRANRITVRYLERDGQPRELDTDGLLAVCIQHEMDHLDGKLFVDYLSPLKREMVRKKLAKQRRHAA